MSNEEITSLCNDIYRGFWIKWRGRVYQREAPEWEKIVADAKALMEKYNYAPLVVHNLQDLLDVLEGRTKANETQ